MNKFLSIIILITILLTGCSTDTTSQDKTATEVQQKEQTKDFVFSYVVVTDNYTTDNSFDTPSDGNRFVRVDFDLVNNIETTLNPFYFELETEQGYYEMGFGGDYNISSDKTLKAGAKGSYFITFEIPTNETPLALLFDNYITQERIELQ